MSDIDNLLWGLWVDEALAGWLLGTASGDVPCIAVRWKRRQSKPLTDSAFWWLAGKPVGPENMHVEHVECMAALHAHAAPGFDRQAG